MTRMHPPSAGYLSRFFVPDLMLGRDLRPFQEMAWFRPDNRSVFFFFSLLYKGQRRNRIVVKVIENNAMMWLKIRKD
ncbi:MAG: hypothetical protein KKE53_03555 [Proteobacteria bacterium]|nr:hypothetical protein [Pseudomonadota bacterium]